MGLSGQAPGLALVLAGSVLLLSFALTGCSTETAKAGASCRRSTQCEAGLACVRGKCSKDLGPIASESTVPDLGLGEGGMTVTMPAAGSGGTATAMPAAGSGK
jgi:hypothetical protein